MWKGLVSKPWGCLRELGRLLAWAMARHRGAAADVGMSAAATRPGEANANRLAAMTRSAARLLERHAVASMVLVGLDDLEEIEEVFGPVAASQACKAALARLRVLAGANGIVCRPAPTRFAVLVPGLTGDRALMAAHAVFGRARCIELDWRGQEILVAASCAARTLTEAAKLEELHEDLCEELAMPLSHRPTVLEERATVIEDRPVRVERPVRLERAAPEPIAYAAIPATVPMRLS